MTTYKINPCVSLIRIHKHWHVQLLFTEGDTRNIFHFMQYNTLLFTLNIFDFGTGLRHWLTQLQIDNNRL